ncbi:lipopolysaccharide biosynthesis protein [Sutcliffiella cohnii]|uniref:lipopolysaccharide biosynthesis protein n=1 Tax=Sutcliffiella cohnii TaxID=33932 RepID=UPI002E1F7FCE|nr:oligosaccharide flippase family protein [Sutcliffiella cohnii]
MKSRVNKLINKIKKDSLMKGFSILFSGTVITQIITLLLAPILTRLYTPAQFGINALFIAILAIFGVVATLRLQFAIAITDCSKEKKALSVICIFTSLIISLLLLILILFYGELISYAFNIDSTNWLWLLPISTFFLGIYEMLFQNLLSRKRYKLMAKVTIVKVTTQSVFQIVLAFFNLGYMGLIIGNLISYIIPVIIMIWVLNIRSTKLNLTKNYCFEVLRKYSDFPKYAFPAELTSITTYSMIPIVITYLFTSSITGYFSLANRLIGIPVGLFGNSLRQVYIREASEELTKKGTVKTSFIRTSKILVFISVPTALCLFIFSPTFFKIVFGDEWIMSGVYVQVLILFFSARLIVGPLISTVSIIGKQKSALFVNLGILLGLMFLTIIFNYLNIHKPVLFLLLVSLIFSSIYLGFYCFMFKVIKKEGLK